MKKLYYSLILLFAFVSFLSAQPPTIECGTPGTSFTINEVNFFSTKPGSSNCIVEYDVSLTAVEVGNYQVYAFQTPLFTIPVSGPGIIQNLTGQATMNTPCIMITSFIKQLRLVTPSGSKCNVNIAALLPVQFTHFAVEEERGRAFLQWGTAKEVNNRGFAVEHTQSGEDWTELGFVEGSGNTDEQQHYEFRTDYLSAGEHYFRLKQIDHDGQHEYSPVASLYLSEGSSAFKLFPNPLKRGQRLNVQGAFDRAELYNAAGKRILQFQSPDAFFSQQFLDLPAGFYHILVQRNNETYKEKLIIH